MKTLQELQAERPLIDWTKPSRIRQAGSWVYICRVCLANALNIETIADLFDTEDEAIEHITKVHAS